MTYLAEKRPPTARERKAMTKLSAMLADAFAPGRSARRVKSETPPGQINMGAVLANSQQPRGVPRREKPFRRTEYVTNPHTPLQIGFFGDVSGSMGSLSEPLGVTRWIVTEAGRRVHAKTSAVLFGEQVKAVQRPGVPQAEIEVYAANEGWEAASTAWAFWADAVNIRSKKQHGVAVFFSDFDFVEESENRAFHAVLEEARRNNVSVIAVTPSHTLWGGREGPHTYGIEEVIKVSSDPVKTANDIGRAILKSI